MDKRNILDKIYRELADSLNISNTMTEEIINSYRAVGNYLGELEEDLDILVFPQGSMALGTLIRPIKDDKEGDYDVDLVCRLDNGRPLTAKEIKNVVGTRLLENERYKKMLDKEGKRCWTLQYADYHMDVLPCVPFTKLGKNHNGIEDTQIRLTHKEDNGEYSNKYSNPKAYREWFIDEMKAAYKRGQEVFANKRNIDVEEVELFNVRTPLQMAIQILKRHRDNMFSKRDNKPISIIITTLAAKAYNGETNLFDALDNILMNMHNFIDTDESGNIIISNPTLPTENFADKWKDNPEKEFAFTEWLRTAQKDIIENPLEFADGFGAIKNQMRGLFGSRAVNDAFDSYEQKNIDARSDGLLGITNRGNITNINDKSVVAPLKDHIFYGK